MTLPEQKICKIIGSNGCYFTSLLYIAELITDKNIDIIDEFSFCNSQKASDNYKWITDEGYVYHPELIVGHCIGKSATVIKTESPEYKENANYDEYLIGCYVWNNNTHFVVVDKKLNVIFDPLGDSNTVKNGKLKSLRIIRLNK